MKSKIISISAIASAFIAICLTVGAYFEVVDLFAVVISSIFVMLPLYLNSYKGSVLCYLAGGLIAFLCSGFNVLSIVFISYFAFCGLYPIVKCKMIDKNFSKKLNVLIGLIWCVAVFYGVYFYYVYVANGIFDGLPSWIIDYVIYLVSVIGVIFFFTYDRFVLTMRIFLNRYLSRIIK